MPDDVTTPPAALPDDLAAVLDAHGVAATVDGLLAAFEGRGCEVWISGTPVRQQSQRWYISTYWVNPLKEEPGKGYPGQYGETPLIALARAFAAIVETEEGNTNGNHD